MAKAKTAPAAETAKTKCPVTREQFVEGAKPLTVQIGNSQLLANVKEEFSSGSFGWYAGDKIIVDIGGMPVRVQVGINLTVVGSKPAE